MLVCFNRVVKVWGGGVVIGLKLSQGAFEAFRASGPMDATEALVGVYM